MTEENDGSPPVLLPSSPPDEDQEMMIEDFPPLPPTPTLPSSVNMEEQDSEDEGPPPGWDNTSPFVPPISSDINMKDVQQDVHNEECQPRSQAHPSPTPELATSEDQQDSEDEGPPPGWEYKCQPEPKLQMACPTTPQSDIKTEDVREYAQNDEGQLQSQVHPSPAPELVQSDIQVEHDSEDDGPPPGWDPKWQPEPKIQPACSKNPQSDIKTEDGQQDAHNEDGLQPESNTHSSQAPELVSSVDPQDSEDAGPPPRWDSKCQPEPMLQMAHLTTPQTDLKMVDAQQDAQNEYDPQPQSHAHPSPAPELVPSDIKVKEQDSEDNGPQPGCDFKCHPKSEPEPELQMACPTTPPSDFKMEDDQQDAQGDEGPPPGWETTPQQQSQIHSNPPSPIVPSGAGMGREQKNVKIVEESPQPPSRQGSVPPTKPQISVPKPPTTIDNHEMGQMVCGSCRRLLSYPRGARYVECACCLEENYVLEEHEVGQLICGGCNVLLMYPYGAPKVRCANCSSETEIGDQNRRLPLSEHKRRARQHLKRVQAG